MGVVAPGEKKTINSIIVKYLVCNILLNSYRAVLHKPMQSAISMTNIHYRLAWQTVT